MTTDMEPRTAFAAGTVHIPAQFLSLLGDLRVPEDASGIVIIVQGAGSSRRNLGNKAVAAELETDGYATLLLDLLTADEQLLDARSPALRADVDLLGERLALTIDWLRDSPMTHNLSIGILALDGAGNAALYAAAARPGDVGAVVMRRGLPYISRTYPGHAMPPTLVIVPDDDAVAGANEQTLHDLAAPEKEVAKVPRSSEQFCEPGAMEQVAQLTLRWFERHLQPAVWLLENARELC